MTVPACLKCNQQFSSDESKFRDFLAIAGSNPATAEADGALAAFKRNIERNDLGRAGKPHKDLQRILDNIRETEFYTPNRIYRGTTTSIGLPSDIDIRGIVLKIARGLHMFYTKEFIPSSYKMAANLYGDNSPLPAFDPDIFDLLQIGGKVGNFFHYVGGWAPENPKAGLWYMLFYGSVIGIALWNNPNWRNAQLSLSVVPNEEATSAAMSE